LNAYLDSSVLLRAIFDQPNPLGSWRSINVSVSSELIRVECLRTIDRVTVAARLEEDEAASRRASAMELLYGVNMVPLDRSILDRAAEPFPTSLGTLDAIHLSTALLVREEIEDLVFATHDRALGIAALAMGFQVEGV
jgi:predicted nucleic acid-binding protein